MRFMHIQKKETFKIHEKILELDTIANFRINLLSIKKFEGHFAINRRKSIDIVDMYALEIMFVFFLSFFLRVFPVFFFVYNLLLLLNVQNNI